MAANTVTSSTGTASGTDPNFVVEYKSGSSNGLVLCVKYTLGSSTSLTITIDVINPSLHATDKYRMTSLSGTALSAYTMVLSAAGNYRIPIALIDSEKKIYANLVFNAAGADGVVVANFVEGA